MGNLIDFKQKTSQLDQALKEISEDLVEKMDILIPSVDKGRPGERRIFEAMRYSSLSTGKRLRPFLVVSSANLFGVGRSSALQAAAAIELIHAYSLVHDDLPAIDNDDMRRGQPSCHKKFDEATAILAGDALLTFAFEVLSDITTHPDSLVRCELIQTLSKAAGCKGMVAGQMMDIMSDNNNELTLEEIAQMQRLKTGALFVLSCETGAILGKAPRPLRNALKGYAQDIGLAFQITDDLLDAKSVDDDSERQNKSEGKPTFVSVMGVDKAGKHAKLLCEQAISHLEVFDKKADLLRELARFLVERQK